MERRRREGGQITSERTHSNSNQATNTRQNITSHAVVTVNAVSVNSQAFTTAMCAKTQCVWCLLKLWPNCHNLKGPELRVPDRDTICGHHAETLPMRRFVMIHCRTTIVVLLSLLAAHTGRVATGDEHERPFDLLIRGGRIIDGTGNPWYLGDVGIQGDRIVAVGRRALR